MTIFKPLLYLLFCLTFSLNLKSQTTDTIRGYIFKDTLRFHTIEQVLKVGKINLSDTAVRIVKFTWIIKGMFNSETFFGVNQGETFNMDLITYFDKCKKYKQASFYFTDIIVEYKYDKLKKVFTNSIAHNIENP